MAKKIKQPDPDEQIPYHTDGFPLEMEDQLGDDTEWDEQEYDITEPED